MRTRFSMPIIAALLLAAPCLSLADPPGNEGRATLIGLFCPVLTGATLDPNRCPEPSHPVTLNFAGIAYTTLGAATVTQSHCQDTAQTSFRGV